jgi:hypothetical protein
MTNELAEFSPPGLQFLGAFYEGNHIAAHDTEAKIQALRNQVAGDGMLVTSAGGEDTPSFELRALEYFYLIENGFNE